MIGRLHASEQNEPKVNPALLTRLKLPAHVLVWAAGRWRRGWVVARDHEIGGWVGMVQYDNDEGVELTEWLPADRIAAADSWLAE